MPSKHRTHEPLSMTIHAKRRMQQRSIPQAVIDALLDFGDRRPAGGGAESVQELADLELACEPSQLSYQLSTLAPIGAADRQRLLVCASPQIRLDALESILGDVEAVFRFALLPD